MKRLLLFPTTKSQLHLQKGERGVRRKSKQVPQGLRNVGPVGGVLSMGSQVTGEGGDAGRKSVVGGQEKHLGTFKKTGEGLRVGVRKVGGGGGGRW